MKKSVCLNMIVKNEAHIIERCLKAALPYFDTWVIVDTGSTDNTKELIQEFLKDVPGELHERPWKNFGQARNEALNLARGKADRLLFLDADDILEVAPDAGDITPEPEAYFVRVEVGCNTSFPRVNFIRDDLPWHWEGAVHEVVICDKVIAPNPLPGWTIKSLPEGARSISSENKFLKDAEMLLAEVEKNPGHTRNVFYLAQSYKDAGELGKSIAWYERRVMLAGWAEEVWYSELAIGRIYEFMKDWPKALAAYLRAYQCRPTRAEPLVALSTYYRMTGENAVAHLFACAAVALPKPPGDILFLDDSVYDWRALDEYAITSFWVGKYMEGLEANERLLVRAPESEHPRIKSNLEFCKGKLYFSQ